MPGHLVVAPVRAALPPPPGPGHRPCRSPVGAAADAPAAAVRRPVRASRAAAARPRPLRAPAARCARYLVTSRSSSSPISSGSRPGVLMSNVVIAKRKIA